MTRFKQKQKKSFKDILKLLLPSVFVEKSFGGSCVAYKDVSFDAQGQHEDTLRHEGHQLQDSPERVQFNDSSQSEGRPALMLVVQIFCNISSAVITASILQNVQSYWIKTQKLHFCFLSQITRVVVG